MNTKQDTTRKQALAKHLEIEIDELNGDDDNESFSLGNQEYLVLNTRSKTDKTAQGKPELPNDKCECGAIAPELCEVYGHLQPQAQHSPLPWKIHSCTDFAIRIDAPDRTEAAYVPTGIMNCDGDETDNANARLIVASVNHAEALAEALRPFVEKAPHSITSAENIRAQAALANWEGAQ